MKSGSGLPNANRSAERTRTVEGCRERDFDDPKTGTMIGGHGYCTQDTRGHPLQRALHPTEELVNLMMFGRAYSNVFDGTKRLGSAKDFMALTFFTLLQALSGRRVAAREFRIRIPTR